MYVNDLLIISNIHELPALNKRFLVCLVYCDGRQVDSVTREYHGEKNEIVNVLKEITLLHGKAVADVETSTVRIFGETFEEPGVRVELRHTIETDITLRLLEEETELLKEIYGYEELNEVEEESEGVNGEDAALSGWRLFLIRLLERFITILSRRNERHGIQKTSGV